MSELTQLTALVDMALKVLSQRVLTILALAMTFGLFCWAMALGAWLHFAIAGAFGITIFLPILWVGKPGVSDGNV